MTRLHSAAAVTLALAACATARRSEPLSGPLLTTSASQDRGRLVFIENCYKCHPGGEAGLGPSLNDKRRPLPLKRFQVRHAPGAMPSFDKSRISDKELSDLMAYLAVLQKHSQRAPEPLAAWEASR